MDVWQPSLPGHMASLRQGFSDLLSLKYYLTYHFAKFVCSSRVYGSDASLSMNSEHDIVSGDL